MFIHNQYKTHMISLCQESSKVSSPETFSQHCTDRQTDRQRKHMSTHVHVSTSTHTQIHRVNLQHSTAIRRLRPGTVCSLSWSGSYHQRPSLCEHLPSVGSDYWTSSKLVKERGVCEIPGSIPSPAKLSKVSGAMPVDTRKKRSFQ